MSPLVSENKENFPVLIVDKIGDIGNHLAKKLSESSTVVFVTEENPPDLENVIHIPYARKIPKIPDNLYSHIFVIDDGEDITLEALPSFFKKAESDRAIFSFCTVIGRKNLPPEIFEYKKSRILFLGDVFPQTGFFPKSYINKFLTTARNRGRIEVPQDGMTISYPIFFEDAILAILESSFGTSNDRIYYIFPKEGFTLLALAHSIQKKDPDIKIDFTNDVPIDPPKITREGKFLYEDKYPLDQRIRSLNLSSAKLSVESIKKSHKKEKSVSSFDLRLALFSILFFLFLPLITTLLFAFTGFLFLDNSRYSGEFAKSQVYLAKSSFSLAQMFSKPLLYETAFIKADPISKLTNSIEKGKRESEDILGFHEGIDLLGVGKTNEGISRIKDFLVFIQTDKRSRSIDKELFNFITQTINVWPQILGVDSKKSYLVLFQNDSSLRGSGGKVEEFGVLTLDKGKIEDFKIFNSYDLEKNLKGHVEPPYALRRYLNSQNFHLMDAGFDTDFGEVAKLASFFVDLETGNKTDGVFRVSSQGLRKILSTGDLGSVKKYLQGKNLAKIVLTKEFVEMLYKKDVIFSFNDKSTDNTLAVNFRSAYEQRENTKTINDSFGLFETDLNSTGYLGKKVVQKTELKENGEISSVVTVDLNNSQDKDMKKYLRFLTPGGSNLKKITIDKEEVSFTDAIVDPAIYEAKDFNPPKSLEIERLSQAGKNIFGFPVKVPSGKTQTIELTFTYPSESLSGLSNFTHNLHFFKQPGANSFPFEFSISFPSSFKIYSEPKVSKTTDKDFDLTFHFTK